MWHTYFKRISSIKNYARLTHLKSPKRFSCNVTFLLLPKLISVITVIIGKQSVLRSVVISERWYRNIARWRNVGTEPSPAVFSDGAPNSGIINCGRRGRGKVWWWSSTPIWVAADSIRTVMQRLTCPGTWKGTVVIKPIVFCLFRYFSSDFWNRISDTIVKSRYYMNQIDYSCHKTVYFYVIAVDVIVYR